MEKQEDKNLTINQLLILSLLKDGEKRTATELIEKTGMNIIASGGVSTMQDVENVKNIGAAGVIIGKALFNGALDLAEVIKKYQ